MHVERRQLSGGARAGVDRGRGTRSAAVLAALLAELRAWAGAEDAAESERKSVRSENNMASRGTRGRGGGQDTHAHTAVMEHAVAE